MFLKVFQVRSLTKNRKISFSFQNYKSIKFYHKHDSKQSLKNVDYKNR